MKPATLFEFRVKIPALTAYRTYSTVKEAFDNKRDAEAVFVTWKERPDREYRILRP